jgi:hypothetical protein
MMIYGDVALRCSTITRLTSGLLFGTLTELFFDIVAFDVLLESQFFVLHLFHLTFEWNG